MAWHRIPMGDGNVKARSVPRLVGLALGCMGLLGGCGDPPSGVFACEEDSDCPEGYSCRIGKADESALLCYDSAGDGQGSEPMGGAGGAGGAGGERPGDDTDASVDDAGMDASVDDAGMNGGGDGGSDAAAEAGSDSSTDAATDASVDSRIPVTCGDLDCGSMTTTCRSYSCDDSGSDAVCKATDATDGTPCGPDDDICVWDQTCATGECAGTTQPCGPAVEVMDAVTIGEIGNISEPRDLANDCPIGEVPIGISGAETEGTFYIKLLTGFHVQCGKLKIVESGGVHSIEIDPAGTSLPPDSQFGGYTPRGATQTATCPANQAIVGYGGTAEALTNAVRQVRIRCAPLNLVGDLQSGYRIEHGAAASVGTVGTSAVGIALADIDCPKHLVGRGIQAFSGDILDGVMLRCGEPIMRSLTTGPEDGLTGSTAFDSTCPAGSYLVGFDANALDSGDEAGRLSVLTPVCGRFFAHDASGLVVENVEVFGSPGSPFGTTNNGTRLAHRCANPNEVVVAVESGLDAAGRVTELKVHCAPLSVTAAAGMPSQATIAIGDAAVLSPALSSTGSVVEARAPHRCPAGTVGVGVAGHADTALDGLALRCTHPKLPISKRLTITPTLDLHIVSSSPDSSFDGLDYLMVEARNEGPGGGSDALLRWDLSSIGAGDAVSYAELRMTAYNGFAWGGNGDVYVQRVAGNSWTAATTWNTAPEAPSSLGSWWLWYGGTSTVNPGVVKSLKVGRLHSDRLGDAIRSEALLDSEFGVRLYCGGYTSVYRSASFAEVDQRPTLDIFHRPLLPPAP